MLPGSGSRQRRSNTDADVAIGALSTLRGYGWRYLPSLTKSQREIVRHPAKRKVLALGRRAGKTSLAIHVLGQEALRNGKPYGYFAPTYKLLSPVWRELKDALGTLIIEKSESDKRIVLVGGGSIECWHMQDEAVARGRRYQGVIIDEAAWSDNLGKVWNGSISPTLTDWGGWAWFLSTPNGRNFFWSLYMRGKRDEDGWHSWCLPTSSNPYIPKESIEEARRSLPQMWFEQEYEAKFLEDSGVVFRTVREAATVPKGEEYNNAHDYVMGIDWGRKDDYTAAVIIDVVTAEVVYVSRFNTVGWNRQRGYLKAIVEVWKPSIILAESNSIGGPNIEALQEEGVIVDGFRTTAASKNPLIDRVALAIEQGKLALLQDEDFLNELEAYTISTLPGGGWRYSAPEGAHDDFVIALALAYRAYISAAEPIGSLWTTITSRGGW